MKKKEEEFNGDEALIVLKRGRIHGKLHKPTSKCKDLPPHRCGKKKKTGAVFCDKNCETLKLANN